MGDVRHEGRCLADDEYQDDDDQYERNVVVLRLTTVLAPHLETPATKRQRLDLRQTSVTDGQTSLADGHRNCRSNAAR